MLGRNTAVSQRVTNFVVLVGWAWVFSLLFAVPAAIYVTIFNLYQTGQVPDLSAFTSAVNPGFVLIGVAVALGGFVLILSNTTFGRENVNASLEQGQEIADEVEERTDGGEPD